MECRHDGRRQQPDRSFRALLGGGDLAAAFDRGLTVPAVDDFQALSGHGVVARVQDARVRVGRPRYLEENGVDLSALRAKIAALEQAGQTVVAVGRDSRFLGAIALGDRPPAGHRAPDRKPRRPGRVVSPPWGGQESKGGVP